MIYIDRESERECQNPLSPRQIKVTGHTDDTIMSLRQLLIKVFLTLLLIVYNNPGRNNLVLFYR